MTPTAEGTPAAPQRLEFKTELKQLLDLIIHSLYTKKEIFLRELISNAADAIDKVRFEALTRHELAEGDSDWKIKIIPDAKAGTLTVRDNGIGMSREAVVENLGTIARSGTKAFVESLKQANVRERPELIGQFGVGFYASFMVADRVTVLSRAAGLPPAEGVRWESDGQGQFTVESFEKASRGTDVVLHLRDDAKEFLAPWRIREIVKRYSDFIAHPIAMDVERPRPATEGAAKEGEAKEEAGKEEAPPPLIEEETLNSRQAIWLRPKAQIKEEEYREFYHQLTRDPSEPLRTIHVAAEGAIEFRALMFLPPHRGMDWLGGPEKKSGLDLYVRRVLISHECEELVPPYLRFVRGVVDSADLPLNVSRETLQHNPLLAKIKSNVVNRVLKTLEEMKADRKAEAKGESKAETKEGEQANQGEQGEKGGETKAEPAGGEGYAAYLKFYKEFGPYLKEGAAQDYANRERLSDLLLFESTRAIAPTPEASGAGDDRRYTSLAEYVARMPAGQKEIYFLIGETRQQIEHSPYLEAFKARGEEVLLMTDPVDEYLVASLHHYKDKPLKAVDRGEIDQPASAEELKKAEQFKGLLGAIGGKIAEVKEVRLSSRLKESAACLVADDGAMSAHLERLLQRMGRGEEVPDSKRVLELNPDHPVVRAMRALHEKDSADPRLENYARLLYDQAVIAEGSKVKDPAAFARRINDLLAKDAAAGN